MESEIAELESFIDSYVGEDETADIQSKTFTNSSAKSDLDDFYDKDFEEELKEHQKLQDFILSDETFQYGANSLSDAADFTPENYALPDNYGDGGKAFVKPQMYYNQNPLFFPYDHVANVDSIAFSRGAHPSTFPLHFNSPETATTVHYGQIATSSGNPRTQKHITEKDLRHRLNLKKQENFQNAHTEVSSRRKKVSPSSRGRYRKKPPESRFALNGRSERSGLDMQEKESYPETSDGQHSRNSSHHSSSENACSSKSSIVSGRSKSEVVSWLHQDSKPSKQSVERQLKNMKISKNSDLLKLVKSANSYIANEEKMKEVAVMICTKAMRNPLNAESGALLCNELSHRIINGTSFRTVLLNIVQEHFKNRRQLIIEAVENDKNNEWFGFVNFLTQLFLHLRTQSNERLKALINPVYDCFFLILEEKSLDYNLSKCFLDNFKIAGPSLNESNPQKMSQLMSVLRDDCVLPGNLPVQVRRNLLQCLEYYARGWKSHALDASYYTTFCE